MSTLKLKRLFLQTVVYLYILLFTYAAVSKLLDYNDFSIKIGQSPILSAFAGHLAIGVPLLELFLVALLCIPRLRPTALFASLCLMTMFTTYIYIILNYSHYVPCSCGGVLENLGWTEHLFFNVVFVLLALACLLIYYRKGNWMRALRPVQFFGILLGGFLLSATSIVGLYLISEDLLQARNPFIRRFYDRSKPEYQKYDLGYNSYYFAGMEKGKIYLGNSTAPLQLSIIDTGLLARTRITIALDRLDFPFRSLQVLVAPPNFYMADGTVPSLYKGSINDWKASYQNKPVPYFSAVAVLGNSQFALRSTSLTQRSQTLGLYSLMAPLANKSRYLLPQQSDGLFDTDGMMLYNPLLDRLHYLYFYRNQYLTLDENMKLIQSGTTIDTITKAVLKVAYTENGEATMAAPPVTVNKTAAVYHNLLFIHSDRIGRYEGKKIVQHASIIDVYDLNNNAYISSFYVYNVGKEKMRSFRVMGSTFYTLTGNYITAVRLPSKILKALK